jgi:hypothetical protein
VPQLTNEQRTFVIKPFYEIKWHKSKQGELIQEKAALVACPHGPKFRSKETGHLGHQNLHNSISNS